MSEVIYTTKNNILDEDKIDYRIAIPDLKIDETAESLEEVIRKAEKMVSAVKVQQDWEREQITHLLHRFKEDKIKEQCDVCLGIYYEDKKEVLTVEIPDGRGGCEFEVCPLCAKDARLIRGKSSEK